MRTIQLSNMAGRSAIASGIIGVMAVAALIAFLVLRNEHYDLAMRMLNIHNIGVIIQFGLLMPVVVGLSRLWQAVPATRNTGLLMVLLTTVCLLLSFVKITSDILYMLPRGGFGAWLIFASARIKYVLSKPARWFTVVVGSGLALIGLFIIAYGIFVSTAPFWIPVAPEEVQQNIQITPVNIFLHTYLLNIGSFLGVLLLPFLTIIIGVGFMAGRLRNALEGIATKPA